jgi:hypothetical protein
MSALMAGSSVNSDFKICKARDLLFWFGTFIDAWLSNGYYTKSPLGYVFSFKKFTMKVPLIPRKR